MMATQLKLFLYVLVIGVVSLFVFVTIMTCCVGGPAIGQRDSTLYIPKHDASRTELVSEHHAANFNDLVEKKAQNLIMTEVQTNNSLMPHQSVRTVSVPATIVTTTITTIYSTIETEQVIPFRHSPDAVPNWTAGSTARLTVADLPVINVTAVDCTALFYGNKKEQDTAQHSNVSIFPSAGDLISQASNCTKFVNDRHYARYPVNDEEAEFRIAFSIIMFKDVQQFERLLRAIYRPQNLYCIHVDNKSSDDIHAAVNAISGCFQNVFVVQKSINVHWGKFSVLEPELVCMRMLLLQSKKWKYFINLTGQEFPLKTNWQIVKILKAFNGSNNMEGTIKRFRGKRMRLRGKMHAPYNINVTKGAVHIVAVRGFVEYVVYNKTSLDFFQWLKDTLIPDESFFASLNHNRHLRVPGSYLGEPETDNIKYRLISRFKNRRRSGVFNWTCHGKRVRGVCIFGAGDLPLLSSRPELFANKFYLPYQHTFDCMEKLHYQRLHYEILAGSAAQFDTSLYESQEFVWNHV